MVINPLNGKITIANIYDTYKTCQSFDEFIRPKYEDTIKPGWIVIAVCKDDCAKSLSNEAKKWFTKMGSKSIWSLKYRHAFGFIGVMG